MAEQIRGMFRMDPPPGGLERLRRALQRGEMPSAWMSLMPWAATAILLLVTAVPMLAASLRLSRADEEATARIVELVRAQEQATWNILPSGRDDVRVYIARLAPADVAAAPPASAQ